MPDRIDLSRRLELRDADGALIGFVLSKEELGELEAECDRLRKELAAYQGHADPPGRANEGPKKGPPSRFDRARHLSRLAMLSEGSPEQEAAWAAVVADLEKNGVDFGEILRELERRLADRTPEVSDE